jgi:hypothetical protein
MKKNLLAFILSIAILTSCKKSTTELIGNEDNLVVAGEASTSISGQFVPNQLVVKFKAGTGEKSRTQTLSFINAKVSEQILTKTMERLGDNNGIYLIHTDMDVNTAMARMKGESNIEYAKPNWIYTHQDASIDTYYTHLKL